MSGIGDVVRGERRTGRELGIGTTYMYSKPVFHLFGRKLIYSYHSVL